MVRLVGRRQIIPRPFRHLSIADRGKPRLKPLFDNFCISRCQAVLGAHIPMRPSSSLVCGMNRRQLLNQAFAKAR